MMRGSEWGRCTCPGGVPLCSAPEGRKTTHIRKRRLPDRVVRTWRKSAIIERGRGEGTGAGRLANRHPGWWVERALNPSPKYCWGSGA